MKYYINTETKTGGKILHFVKMDTGFNKEVSYIKWMQSQKELVNGNNTILIDGENIVFSAVVYTHQETESQIILRYTGYYEHVYTSKIQELDYKIDGSTVALYLANTQSLYHAECKALANWREAMVSKNYEILNAVKAGQREMPSKEQYLSELPLYTTYEL